MKALEYIAAQPWAITPEGLQQIIAIAERENLSLEEVQAKQDEFDAIVASQFGQKLEGTSRFSRTTVRDGIAIIPVKGPVFAYANFFNRVSGATSLDTLSEDLTIALESQDVRSILLYVDSPGGEVTGTNEFAKMLSIAATMKPIKAYVAGSAASAAYWIASAADEIVVDDTAQLGSIGVLAVIKEDTGKSESARGINTHRFVSSQSPNKRPKLDTEDGQAVVQKTVDDLAQVFVETVAANRGVSVETVLSDFGQGGVLVGKTAVDAGLADRIGSFKELFAEMSGGKGKRKPRSFAANSNLPSMGAKGEQKTMSTTMKERILALFKGKGADDEEVTAQLDVILGSEATDNKPTPTASQNADDERVTALQAQVQQLRASNREAKAGAFTDALLEANKTLPAETDALSALYIQCASDDDESPLAEGSRCEMLKAFCEARPAHTLTQPKFDKTKHQALENEDGKKQELTAERKQELLESTSFGRTVAATK